jgi:hypothetical protein
MTGGSPKVLNAIDAAIANINAGDYMVIVYDGTTAGANAGVYAMHVVASTANLVQGANYTIEHIATLTGVGSNTLTSADFI